MIRKFLVKNKKAQIFAILAIFLIMLTFASFELFSFLHKQKSTQERVSSMDSFLSSLEKNLERQVYISGFRILFLAEREISNNGIFIQNITAFFEEAYFNGTVNGSQIPDKLLDSANYTSLIKSINDKANKINVYVLIDNSSIFVSQSDPWTVNFTLVSDFVMSDMGDLASWRKKQFISAYIPVTSFEDPFFVIAARGNIDRKIKKTIYDGNYNIPNLQDHVLQGYYSNNSHAPNFLMRLAGNLSSDPNGIESFVDISYFDSNGLNPDFTKTTIDYIYFNPLRDPAYCSVNGIPIWFKIDNEDGHYSKYNITSTYACS